MTLGRYRHKRCKDIDIEIVKISYRGKDYIKAKVYYLSQRNNLLFWLTPETVKIYRKDFSSWQRV